MEKRILDRDVTFLGHRNWLLSIYLITLGFFLNVILSVNCPRERAQYRQNDLNSPLKASCVWQRIF